MNVIRSIFSVRLSETNNRVLVLDYIRGILIILVVYQHAPAPFRDYILQFHMPALFILSGYTDFVLNRNKSCMDYIKSRFLRLIVPYFLFELGTLLLHICVQIVFNTDSFSIFDAIKCIVLCLNEPYTGVVGRLWFLPAMFFCSVFSWFIKKISGNRTYMIALFALVMLGLSYISSYIIPFRLPFAIDISFLGTFFSLIGTICGKAIKQYLDDDNRLRDVVLLAAFALIYLICNVLADPGCFMYKNEYTDFPVMILTATSATAFVFVLAKLLSSFFRKKLFLNDLVVWYSINSLATFPIHLIIKFFAMSVLRILGIENWALLFIIMFTLNIPIVNIINRYFPFMLGSFKRVK